MTSDETSRGVILASLEAELNPKREDLRQLLLVHGLFCKSIGLSDSHILDNQFMWSFFDETSRYLSEEEVTDRQPSLFSICGKAGADLWSAVDMYLIPKGPEMRPTYLSALSPRQNGELQSDYDSLVTPGQRRSRLLEIAGPRFEAHVARAIGYFNRHPTTVLHASHEASFATTVEAALGSLKEVKLGAVEGSIVRRMQTTLGEWNPAEGYFSRERLHESIYQTLPIPRVWRGHVVSTNLIPDAAVCNPWRHYVNALHNQHHASLYDLDVVASPDLRMPSSLRRLTDSPVRRSRDLRKVRLPTSIFMDYLDVEFVTALRRDPEFWNNMESIDSASRFSEALSAHVVFVAERFKEHLFRKGQRRLVRKTVAEIVTEHTDPAFAVGTPVVAGVALAYGLPELAWGVIKTGTVIGAASHVVIKSMFSGREADTSGFRSFKAGLKRAGRAIREAGHVSERV